MAEVKYLRIVFDRFTNETKTRRNKICKSERVIRYWWQFAKLLIVVSGGNLEVIDGMAVPCNLM